MTGLLTDAVLAKFRAWKPETLLTDEEEELISALSTAIAERDEARAETATAFELAKKSVKATMMRLGDHPDIRAQMAPQVMWAAGDSCCSDIDKIVPEHVKAALATAIAERDAARAEVARLREALEPFAFVAGMEERAEPGASVIVNVDRCRDARAALATPSPEPAGDQ